MNNNNRNNNRRRGRGNRNQGGGGGHQQNRIDSRARGNAPQLLDKYKKLAQDAAHNGDRVQAEYFLQFADHYFRVIADNRSRQDEQRGRRDERDQDDFIDDEDDGEDRRRHVPSQNQNPNQNRGRPRPRRDEGEQFERGVEGDEAEADDNPFMRDDRDDRPVQDRQPRERQAPERQPRERQPREERTERRPRRRAAPEADASSAPADFDAAVLPPSLTESLAAEAKPKARARRRRANNDEDAPEAVNS